MLETHEVQLLLENLLHKILSSLADMATKNGVKNCMADYLQKDIEQLVADDERALGALVKSFFLAESIVCEGCRKIGKMLHPVKA